MVKRMECEINKKYLRDNLWDGLSIIKLLQLLTGETFRVVKSNPEERIWKAVSKCYEFKFIDCGNGWCLPVKDSFKKKNVGK